MNFVKKYQLLFLFIAVIFLPILNSSIGPWKFERKDENRTFKDSLNIDFYHLGKFPKEGEAFINDNFSFRRPLLDISHYFKFHYFKVSPHPDKTIVGNENWFYRAEKEKDIYEGKRNLSNEELANFGKEWKNRKAYLDSCDIKCYWVIAPMKHNIYPEYLPFNVSNGGIKRVDQLKDYFQASMPDLIIDPTPEFMDAKKDHKLYYKLDNHWNQTSGYIVSKLLLSKIKSDFPAIKIRDIPTYKWKNTKVQGGFHYGVLGVDDLFEVDRIPKINNPHSIESEKYKFTPIEEFPYPEHYEKRYLNKSDKSGLKILFIMDSFGTRLMPFIPESFEESVFIFDAWRYNLNKPIIEIVKPNIVVFLTVDPYLKNLLEYK